MSLTRRTRGATLHWLRLDVDEDAPPPDDEAAADEPLPEAVLDVPPAAVALPEVVVPEVVVPDAVVPAPAVPLAPLEPALPIVNEVLP
jgi:hypothetical protein